MDNENKELNEMVKRGMEDLEKNMYYVNYKNGNDEWLEMKSEGGVAGSHSFVCYGYIKVREID